MNFVMDDNSWAHFEFQSQNEGLEGLKRFRIYESLASYQHKIPVITYVLFSGKIKRLMTEFTEGLNTYRIAPIIMQNHKQMNCLEDFRGKRDRGEAFVKEDLALLTLCLLMGGKIPLKDRVKATYQITQSTASVSKDELEKAETVLYVMADKFLDSDEMDDKWKLLSKVIVHLHHS